MQKEKKVEELIALIKPKSHIFIHGGAANPQCLTRELARQGVRVQGSVLYHLHTEGDVPYLEPQALQYFKIKNLFVGSNMRAALDYDRVDYIPCFLSEIGSLFKRKVIPIDVALIHISPPDPHGYCSLGVSVDVAKAAVESAGQVLAQMNPKMPRTLGDGLIHLDQLAGYCEVGEEIPEHFSHKPGEVASKIGKLVSNLIDDGSTLQAGIGGIPDAVLTSLNNHRHLGVHSEMWSDHMLDLIETGAVDNRFKKVHPGKSVSTFLMGSRRLYDFIHDNPSVIQLEASYVNEPTVIARNPKVIAINSAVEVDLTGQVCADSVGHRVISGVGGQVDFIRGATRSEGGKAIIALPSRSKAGKTRLVAELKPGAGVVTTRAHVHYVVTEFGTADLYGRSLNERAKSLIAIAHPDDRETIERNWFELSRS